ncbi:MAG: sigma-54-dependent Fis family transcriptional regulator [Calditrichaeota bacterium]|nr:sigma-54-dependent Fis family transcriptional regulator [Calditrichota bacterium]
MPDKSKIKILVVDDVQSSLSAVEKGLSKIGYSVTAVQSAIEAAKLIKSNSFNIVVTDLKMPELDGSQILQEAKKQHPETIVIVMTGYSSVESAVELMQQGAFYYIKKPIQINELRDLVERGLKRQGPLYSGEESIEGLDLNYGYGVLIAQSKRMKDILKQLQAAAKSKSTILLTGESGTGKEALTRIIHNNSPRKYNPFIAVNCSAFSVSLLESQLFGHEKGAFTGATNLSKGIFESADTGTIFLDEISEMSLPMQAKLLRVLETKEFMRLGSSQTYKTDIRIIAASNKNLQNEVEAGNFREDLYYRLSVITLNLPPLRERKEDIPILARYFLNSFAEENKSTVKTLTNSSIDLLTKYEWPGNIRELKNIIERASITIPKQSVNRDDLIRLLPDFEDETGNKIEVNIGKSMSELEKAAIIETLKFTNGNRTKAAEILKIGLRTLQRKIKEYHIN